MAQQVTDPPLRSASRWRSVKDVIDTLTVLGFLYLLYSAFAHKAAYINKIYGPYAGCSDCFTRSVFAHDGAMLALFLIPGLALLLPITVYAYQLQPFSYAHDRAMTGLPGSMLWPGRTSGSPICMPVASAPMRAWCRSCKAPGFSCW